MMRVDRFEIEQPVRILPRAASQAVSGCDFRRGRTADIPAAAPLGRSERHARGTRSSTSFPPASSNSIMADRLRSTMVMRVACGLRAPFSRKDATTERWT